MFAFCHNNPISFIDPTGEVVVSISTLILIGSAALGAGLAGYTAYKEYQAGYNTIRIIGDSVCAGIAGFSIVYSCGMSLYQCYINYCYLNALTPVTSIGTETANITTVDLYRAVSPEEYTTTVNTQTFSPGANSYAESKYFATTYDDAATWGSKMYRTDPYLVMTVTMDTTALTSYGTEFYPSLDAIGPAYLIPNTILNHFVLSVK